MALGLKCSMSEIAFPVGYLRYDRTAGTTDELRSSNRLLRLAKGTWGNGIAFWISWTITKVGICNPESKKEIEITRHNKNFIKTLHFKIGRTKLTCEFECG